MKRLDELFETRYGTSLELNRLREVEDGGIPFVARSTRNNGVTARVEPLEDVPPIEPGTLTVALSGSGVLQTFLQERPYYTGYHVAVLTPLQAFDKKTLLAYAFLIGKNRFRYGWGRQANKSLRSLQLPEPHELPPWLAGIDLAAIEAEVMSYEPPVAAGTLSPEGWKVFKYTELFEIVRGKGPSLADAKDSPGPTPYVTASDFDNGVSAWTSFEPEHPGGVITVAKDGAPGAAFYQPAPFCANSHVHVLAAKAGPMPAAIGIFLATLIRQEMVKYGYSRAWGLQRMTESTVHLPATPEGLPDFAAMGHFVRGLPSWSRLPQEATRD